MKIHRIIPIVTLGSLLLAWQPSAARAQNTIEQLTAAAQKGNPEAQYRLGQAFVRGVGVKKDLRQAHDLIKQAADQGHADAIGGLGYFYATGLVVKKDLSAAAEWFRQGAEKGGPRSQLNYGQALLNGRGVPENDPEGMKWIEKALAQELPEAHFAIGEFCYHGTHGYRQDYQKARESLEKAVEADHAAAENMLGVIYQEGLGVSPDLVKAELWFRKSAEQGYPRGMSNLGQLLGPDGPDATKHVEALKWLLLAHRANEPAARNVLNEILRTRPPAVVKEAQEQVAKFQPRPSVEKSLKIDVTRDGK